MTAQDTQNARKFELVLPYKGNSVEEPTIIPTNQRTVFIGANGAGKTRLGVWIEKSADMKTSKKYPKTHRISAQKSLAMPKGVSLGDVDGLGYRLQHGNDQSLDSPDFDPATANRTLRRFGKDPAIQPLSDYKLLVTFLLSEHAYAGIDYREASKNSTSQRKLEISDTKIESVQKIWKKIIPHRELIIESATIKTQSTDKPNIQYSAAEMSDGERVIFYLIGQCLSAPDNAIIIIDEPEMHLHKSIQQPLWSEIEKQRLDCMFLYFTHDVSFAAGSQQATKIWIKSYDGSYWDWEEIEGIDGFPEALLLEILGNRKPVVFVEGDHSSIDAALYKSILSDFLVFPSGSCEQVITYTKAMGKNEAMHHLKVYGIIDRDRRSDAEIEKLKKNNIYTLDVAEVEHLFCTEEILAIIHAHMKLPEDTIEKIKAFVFEEFEKDIPKQISSRTINDIQHRLKSISLKDKGQDAIKAQLDKSIADISYDEIWQENKDLFEHILDSKDYAKLLKFYNRKGLAKQMSGRCGVDNLPQTVSRLAAGSKQKAIKDALKKYFGGFFEAIEDKQK